MSNLGDLLRAGDPDRYLATRAAPDWIQARLWPLYAFNLEIARAPYVTAEPMIAQMRLQFWHDVLDEIAQGARPRAHEVATPLAQVWREAGLPLDLGHAMTAARNWDIARVPFADEAAFEGHIDATSGHLMWLSARALGAAPHAEPVVRDLAHAAGLAQWFLAVPALKAAGQTPLIDESPDTLRRLAGAGLARLARARAARGKVARNAGPALMVGWQAGAILRRARAAPERITQGALASSEFSRRGSLLLRVLSGRW